MKISLLSLSNYLWSCLLFFIFIQCSKKSDPTPLNTSVSSVKIDPAFQKYVDIFLAEGIKRGRTINLSTLGINMQFGNTSVNGIKYSGYTFKDIRTIYIDNDTWQSNFATDSFKEWLILHELGHLILNRNHRNVALGNGETASMMNSPQELNFYNSAIYQGVKRKKYYLDELFFYADAVLPDWGDANLINTVEPTTVKTLVAEENFDDPTDLLNLINTTTNINGTFNIKANNGILTVSNAQTTRTNDILISDFLKKFEPKNIKNYEVRFRFKNSTAINALFFWGRNNDIENLYSFTLNNANEIYVRSILGWYKSNANTNYNDWNDVTIRYENQDVYVWMNGKLILTADSISSSATDSWKTFFELPVGAVLNIDFIKVYQF